MNCPACGAAYVMLHIEVGREGKTVHEASSFACEAAARGTPLFADGLEMLNSCPAAQVARQNSGGHVGCLFGAASRRPLRLGRKAILRTRMMIDWAWSRNLYGDRA